MKRLSTQQLSIEIAEKKICADLTFTLASGEIWGVLGANGSGKTSLLHTLAGLRAPTNGAVLLNDIDIKTLNAKLLARSIGILFQDSSAVFSQTVWEYCLASRYPHRTYLQRETLADQQITYAALQTMELQLLKQRKITEISGGEKRRLAMAAVLTQSPDFYLLDEPTNHLDVRYQMQILQHVTQIAREGAGIMMAMHDINLTQQFCNHIMMLFADGEIIFGKTRDILTQHNLTRLYQHPFRSVLDDEVKMWVAR